MLTKTASSKASAVAMKRVLMASLIATIGVLATVSATGCTGSADAAENRSIVPVRSAPAKVDGQKTVLGKLGEKVTLEQGKVSARLVGINILATVRAALGSLDKVKRLVKTLGMVNSAPGFLDHPLVINGFSELMAEVFGEDAGVGARSAVGMGALPGDIPVEIECIFEV